MVAEVVAEVDIDIDTETDFVVVVDTDTDLDLDCKVWVSEQYNLEYRRVVLNGVQLVPNREHTENFADLIHILVDTTSL